MAADEEQQLDLFDNSSESRFNELSYSEQPQTEENDAEGREAQTLRALREPAARTPLVGDEEQEKVRARKHPEEASSCVAAQEPMKGSTSKTQVEPLLVSREAAGAGAGAGRTRAVARGMGSISQEGGLEPRAGSSAGSSVKGVAAANAPSTASLSTQVLPHIGFETKVSFDAQHELAKSRSSRFRPRLSSARSSDCRLQGRVTQQLTVTGVLVEEPRPIDFRLQAFAPRPPKRNTRESVRPERFGGQHLHLARARTDAHTRPRSRGDTQSPNLDDLELAHVPVVASRVARSNLFLDGADADGTGGFSFSASTGHTGTSTGTSKASSSTGLKPKSAISGLRSSTEKKARTARLEERPSFNARVRLSRPFTCKRLAATDERPGVQPYVSTRSYEFREVPKARTFGADEFDARFEKDPFRIKFMSRTLDTIHLPASASIAFRDADDSLWTDPIVRHPEAHGKMHLPRTQWPDRFAGTTRHRLQWRDPRQAFLERVEEVVGPVWASQQLTGRESPVAVLPLASASSTRAAAAPIASRPQALTARV